MYEAAILIIHVSNVMLIVWLLRERQQLRDALWAKDKAMAYERIRNCGAIAELTVLAHTVKAGDELIRRLDEFPS